MEFTVETRYDAKSMACMARALRKTVRKKGSRRSYILGGAVIILALLLLVSRGFTFDVRTAATLFAAVAIAAVLLFEDRINGYAAEKRLLPGTEKAVTVFSEDGFVSVTDVGKSEWKYDKISCIAETDGFFVFVFSTSHAQLYDKRGLRGGSVDEFRRFLETASGKQVQRIKGA